MARSLRGGVFEILKNSLARGIAADLARRQIIDDVSDSVTDIQTALSSWDNCMAVSWCQYPVIAIIVVGGLILISIVWCIVRCCCCGLSCCCSCFRCLQCCGDCCGACDPPRKQQSKYLDAPYIPPDQGYRTEAPMQSSFPSIAPNHPPAKAPPQYAEFDAPRKGGEDALPEMPSWESSSSKKVLVEEEAVELETLKKKIATPEQQVPLMTGASSVATSPMPMEYPGAYGQPQGNNARGYMDPQSRPLDPYGQAAQGNGYAVNQGPVYDQDQPYDMPPAPAAAAMMGRQSPALGRQSPALNPYGYDANRMNQGYPQPAPLPNDYGNYGGFRQGSPAPSADGYGMRRRGTGDNGAMGAPAPYGVDSRARNSPGPMRPSRPDDPYQQGPRQSPAPQNGRGYGAPSYNPPQDDYNRSYSPGPNRQYGGQSPPSRMPQSPNHSSGFDVNPGYTRPYDYDRRPSESREDAGQEGYPGYKPYGQGQNAWSGI
ncbi:hypothetical protein S40293_05300 [Stachybotrys chartarum IBT 40293]|nr:hypothetical protein S40293_05300 [Stachybotrys chartarum IBT 40293]